MVKTFLRSFYITFLWVVLFANILYAFDLVGIATIDFTLTNADVDYSTKYFGISTIFNFFQNIDRLTNFDNNLLFSHYQKIQELALDAFKGENFSVSVDNDFFRAILEVLARIADAIYGVILYAYSMVVLIACWVYVLVAVFYAFIKMIGGYGYKAIPPTAMPVTI